MILGSFKSKAQFKCEPQGQVQVRFSRRFSKLKFQKLELNPQGEVKAPKAQVEFELELFSDLGLSLGPATFTFCF